MKRIVLLCSLILLSVVLVVGCMGGGDRQGDAAEREDELKVIYAEEEKTTIRVYTAGELSYFMEQLGDEIEKQFKHINLEVHVKNIFTEGDIKIELENYFAEHQIDLIFAPDYYEDWAEEGLLLALDVYLEDRGFEVEQIHPSVLDLLRAEDGRIYGLAPMFTSQGLFYNKDIFDQYEVEYPHDQMSWEDVLALAEQFPVGEMAGLYERNAHGLVFNIANANGISLLHEDGAQVHIAENEEFQEMLESIVAGLKRGSISTIWEYDLFLEEEAAMTVQYQGYVDSLWDQEHFDWDVAIEPRSLSRANQSYSLVPTHTLSIYGESEQANQAWEIIKHLNSEAYAAQLVAENPNQLVSRTAHIRNTSDKNMRAFYTSTRSSRDSYISSPMVRNFEIEFSGVTLAVLPRILSGSLTIEEGLQEMQKLTQQLIDNLLEGSPVYFVP